MDLVPISAPILPNLADLDKSATRMLSIAPHRLSRAIGCLLTHVFPGATPELSPPIRPFEAQIAAKLIEASVGALGIADATEATKMGLLFGVLYLNKFLEGELVYPDIAPLIGAMHELRSQFRPVFEAANLLATREDPSQASEFFAGQARGAQFRFDTDFAAKLLTSRNVIFLVLLLAADEVASCSSTEELFNFLKTKELSGVLGDLESFKRLCRMVDIRPRGRGRARKVEDKKEGDAEKSPEKTG
jgi:hypothetical protein